MIQRGERSRQARRITRRTVNRRIDKYIQKERSKLIRRASNTELDLHYQ